MISLSVSVNGVPYREDVPDRLLLSDFLRHTLGRTGTHVGCEHGVCGACTVLLDGVAIRSCITLAAQADGHELRTVEGLADGGKLNPLQQSFKDCHALQCGLHTRDPHGCHRPPRDGSPDRAEIEDLLSGHLCRCIGYTPIVDAIEKASLA